MGRLPKPPHQVRRPERQRWRRLDAPTDPNVPALPEREDGAEWTREAVTAWEAWWRSPMATAWIEADAVALGRAIRLVDDDRGLPTLVPPLPAARVRSDGRQRD
jgi:hypothetical protein